MEPFLLDLGVFRHRHPLGVEQGVFQEEVALEEVDWGEIELEKVRLGRIEVEYTKHDCSFQKRR